jgi:RNA polymerase sigma-70 factor (ECF subfamily)
MSSPVTAELSLPLTGASDTAIAPASAHDEVLRLFDACAPALWRHVRTCGLSPESADDVVQDTFVALYRHLRKGGGRENLHGWLVRVSHRLALKQRQRQARRGRHESAWDGHLADTIGDGAAGIEAQLTADVDRRRLRAVFRALPERDRQCLSLRAEGLRYREIAGALGISLGLVAKTLARAAMKLSRAAGE